MQKLKRMLGPLLLALLGVMPCCAAEPVTVSVTTSNPGIRIPENALGVSYETSLLLPDEHGVRYFRPDNKPLVNAFRTLGIKSLRIGGNSVDAKVVPIPSDEDVVSLMEFARAAGVKVIYSFRLEDGDPHAAAETAKLIHDRYADVLDTFAIGNEPYYYKDFAVYSQKWRAIRDAILAVDPEARFCGPDQNPKPKLLKEMAKDFGNPAGRLVQLTVHNYPFGCAYKQYKQEDITKLDSNNATSLADGRVLVPFDAAASRDKMLSPKAYATYEQVCKDVTDATAGTALTFRLTEVNSFWFSGLKGASDSCASALWGVDFLYWWESHGAAGLNFHTGDRTGGTVTMPCRYAVFVSSANGYEMRPLGYGLKLFDLGGHGQLLPTDVASKDHGLIAYATLSGGKSVSITLINKSHGATAADAQVRIALDAPLAQDAATKAIFLTFRNGDIGGGSSDVMLGGAPIKENGTWKGTWAPLTQPADGAHIDITIPAASAAVVRTAIR